MSKFMVGTKMENKATKEVVTIINVQEDGKLEVVNLENEVKVVGESSAKKYYKIIKEDVKMEEVTIIEEVAITTPTEPDINVVAPVEPVVVPRKGKEQNVDIQTVFDNLVVEASKWDNIEVKQQPKYTGLYFGGKKNIVELHLNKTNIRMHLRVEALSPDQIAKLFRVVPESYLWALEGINVVSTLEDYDFALELLQSGYAFESNKVAIVEAEKLAKLEAKATKDAEKELAKATKLAEKIAKDQAKALEIATKELAKQEAKVEEPIVEEREDEVTQTVE